jgi:fructan beta-fructosidase
MLIHRNYLLVFALILMAATCPSTCPAQTYHELYRPGFHFSPKEKWMNDPNGLVRFDGVYHLFFQYYPGDIVWGPMHWGHATSRDLIHWQQQPIALYPDSLGYIFSGSVVVDSNNTSGLGSGVVSGVTRDPDVPRTMASPKGHHPTVHPSSQATAKETSRGTGRESSRETGRETGRAAIPLIAVFTQHDTAGEHRHALDFQRQSIAYSLDKGATWTKFAGNPVLPNPGIADFRDPNVNWYAKGKKWVMALATKDRITFYSSPDLKDWKKESDFGEDAGAHGGVWECPSLFPMMLKVREMERSYWVLLVSNNPGGPNGGSGTQYFIGQWDGHVFKPLDTLTRWIDYGPDDYAGAVWNNTGRRRIFLGWMSNWDYANQLPTASWRNAMTIPRNLFLQEARSKVLLASQPAQELEQLVKRKYEVHHLVVDSSSSLTNMIKDTAGRYILDVSGPADGSVAFVFSNTAGERLVFGYNAVKDQYYLDRSGAGRTDFHPGFNGIYSAPRLTSSANLDLQFVMDRGSLEVFADGGLTVMTGVFFAQQPLTHVRVNTTGPWTIKKLSYQALASIW